MAIDLTITIPDLHRDRIAEAFDNRANVNLRIEAEHGVSWDWKYPVKKASENYKQYGEAILRGFIRAFVRHYEFNNDFERYHQDVGNLEEPHQTVPDEIIE